MIGYEDHMNNGHQDAVDKLVAERDIDVAKSINKPPIKSKSRRERIFLANFLEKRSKSKRRTAKKPSGAKGKNGGDPYEELEKKDQHIGDL